MTVSVLLTVLILLTLLRSLFHLKPTLLGSLNLVSRTKVLGLIDTIVGAGLVAILLIHFVVRSFYIPSGSMEPTLKINDFILVDQVIYNFTNPGRGDIVVFRSLDTYGSENTDFIKRVVGVEYDKIEVRDGKLLLNDRVMHEDFIKEGMSGDFAPQVVQEGHCFVMGDHRNNSRDSRYIGQIPLQKLVGRAEFIFYPPSRSGFLNSRP